MSVQLFNRKRKVSELKFSVVNESPGTRPLHPRSELPLHDLLAQLSSVELAFFAFLDSQLDKIESFYLAREKEMLVRGTLLQEQLSELNEHRKIVMVCSIGCFE